MGTACRGPLWTGMSLPETPRDDSHKRDDEHPCILSLRLLHAEDSLLPVDSA